MDLMYYSPMDVHASILSKKIEGFVEGSFIVIEPVQENAIAKTCMDGMVQILARPTHIHNVTISLQQTSPLNQLLHTLMILHQKFGSKLRIPLQIKDFSTGSSFYATEVWFKKEPTVTYGTEMNTIEWTFVTKNAVRSIKGNGDGDGDDNSSDLVDMVSQATQLAGIFNLDLSSMLGTAGGIFSKVSSIF